MGHPWTGVGQICLPHCRCWGQKAKHLGSKPEASSTPCSNLHARQPTLETLSGPIPCCFNVTNVRYQAAFLVRKDVLTPSIEAAG